MQPLGVMYQKIMVISTPIQSEIVLENIVNGNYWNKPIMENFQGFEVYFVGLHPFYQIKQGHENKIKFENGNWPNKREIIDHCEKLTWSEFMIISGINDYKHLDHALSFREWARPKGDKKYFDILSQTLNIKHKEIIAPTTDAIPDILIDHILNFFKSFGHSNFYLKYDYNDEEVLKNLDSEIINESNFGGHQIIKTIDSKLQIVTDFDCHQSYFMGEKNMIYDLVNKIDLEGFYCDRLTTRNWSFDVIPEERVVDWNYTLEKIHYA